MWVGMQCNSCPRKPLLRARMHWKDDGQFSWYRINDPKKMCEPFLANRRLKVDVRLKLQNGVS